MQDQLSTREAIRIELVRNVVRGDGALERAFTQALRLSAGALDVRRVGIWFGEDGWKRIRCRMMFDAQSQRLASGDVIELSPCPNYAAALRSRRAIVASDALADPRTGELREYLVANGIGAMLDSPIFHQGELVGIVCHEHMGPPREWNKQDTDFVTTISDMIGLYLEQDETERTYRQLLETRKELEAIRVMESLGRLAAGVAHDFNNLLGAVGLKTDLLVRRTPGDEVARFGAEIDTLVDQGARLVKQLLTFARSEPSVAEVVNLVDVLRASESLLRTVANDDIALHLTFADVPLLVRIERSRAEQVLLNLAVNARDALLGGGRIDIGVALDTAGYAVLTVADTGIGMDEHTRERIFEPFFTTKKRDERAGAGLGLATVYGIVKESGGDIECASTLGDGTTFRVRLPLVGA